MTVTDTQRSGTPVSRSEQQWSYASATSDTPLLGLTIGDLFDQTAARFPDQPALIARQQQVRLSYRQLQEQVNQCAKGLLHLGLQKGQRIGIWSPNRAEWCIAQFATAKLGTILVNINPAYRLHELEYALTQSGCSTLILAGQFKSSNYTEMLIELAPELNNCQAGQLSAARLPALTSVIRLGPEQIPGMLRWDDLLALGNNVSAEQLAARQNEQEFDDPINIQLSIRLVRWTS